MANIFSRGYWEEQDKKKKAEQAFRQISKPKIEAFERQAREKYAKKLIEDRLKQRNIQALKPKQSWIQSTSQALRSVPQPTRMTPQTKKTMIKQIRQQAIPQQQMPIRQAYQPRISVFNSPLRQQEVARQQTPGYKGFKIFDY